MWRIYISSKEIFLMLHLWHFLNIFDIYKRCVLTKWLAWKKKYFHARWTNLIPPTCQDFPKILNEFKVNRIFFQITNCLVWSLIPEIHITSRPNTKWFEIFTCCSRTCILSLSSSAGEEFRQAFTISFCSCRFAFNSRISWSFMVSCWSAEQSAASRLFLSSWSSLLFSFFTSSISLVSSEICRSSTVILDWCW